MKKLKEVFRVFPEYQKVSKKRKIRILVLLIKWAEKELRLLK